MIGFGITFVVSRVYVTFLDFRGRRCKLGTQCVFRLGDHIWPKQVRREMPWANQRPILSGGVSASMDVPILGKGMGSARYDTGEKMRYSYVRPDGATYDVSDMVEEG